MKRCWRIGIRQSNTKNTLEFLMVTDSTEHVTSGAMEYIHNKWPSISYKDIIIDSLTNLGEVIN